MTNIQAINLLKGLEQSLDDYCELNDEGKTAFRMAVTALEVFGISEQLPSAQPEIIHCKECKHHHRDNSGAYYCERKEYGYGWGLNDFCSDAERRTDEQ